METIKGLPDTLFFPLREIENFNEQLIERLRVKFQRLERTVPGLSFDFKNLCRKLEDLGMEERAFFLLQLSEIYLSFIFRNSEQVQQLKARINMDSTFGQLLVSYIQQFPEEFME
jgi:hypothetical protein